MEKIERIKIGLFLFNINGMSDILTKKGENYRIVVRTLTNGVNAEIKILGNMRDLLSLQFHLEKVPVTAFFLDTTSKRKSLGISLEFELCLGDVPETEIKIGPKLPIKKEFKIIKEVDKGGYIFSTPIKIINSKKILYY